MKILYHHRTRATDAQKVHILEMIEAFRQLGHQVAIASLVETEHESHNPEKDAETSAWKKLLLRVPLASEIAQLGYNVIALPWLLYKIRSTGAELVYERYSLFNFSGVLAAALSGRPIVLEVNSPLALELSREKEIRASRFAGWMERIICNSATRVVVVSGPLRRMMIQSGVRDSQLYLLPNGVNLKRFAQEAQRDLRDSLGIKNRTVIGFVCWFRRWHGIELLIEAFGKSGLCDSKAVLLLVGDGPAMPELRAQVEKNGIQNSVIFTGPVSHRQIPSYLGLFDIAVQPAANEYCCPMKILEYMGLAKAIVAPRQENIEELLDDGCNAVLFEPGDAESLGRALEALAKDTALRSTTGENALRTIHKRGLLWESNAQRVVDMFQSTAGYSGA
jgi:glycosyltransferase involved in cell wall biosynthesis